MCIRDRSSVCLEPAQGRRSRRAQEPPPDRTGQAGPRAVEKPRGESMIDNLNAEQLEAILDTLPMNFIFVDEKERLIYRNKADARTASRAPDIIGEDIRGCHKQSSLPRFCLLYTSPSPRD